jgi:hypothetical protein
MLQAESSKQSLYGVGGGSEESPSLLARFRTESQFRNATATAATRTTDLLYSIRVSKLTQINTPTTAIIVPPGSWKTAGVFWFLRRTGSAAQTTP